ncbi:MAG: hypothetical protein ACKVS6_01835, partial [Planctomycetota bacterium]
RCCCSMCHGSVFVLWASSPLYLGILILDIPRRKPAFSSHLTPSSQREHAIRLWELINTISK